MVTHLRSDDTVPRTACGLGIEHRSGFASLDTTQHRLSVSCVECIRVMGPAERLTLPTPIENLLPLGLRRAYMQDTIVNAAFHMAARWNVTREQALIDTVLLLVGDRERLMEELKLGDPRTRVPADSSKAAEPECPYCVGALCPDHQPLHASGAPGHTLCDYDDCDQEPTVTLPKGAVMCAHHAAVALLASMSPEEAQSTFRFARPVPETEEPPEAGELIFVNDPTPGKERDWFFTFGSGHELDGESLGRAFVRIHGTAREARRRMVARFGQKWSHQYASEEEAGVQRFGLIELKLEGTDG